MKNATEAQGWKTVAAVRTPLGAPDFSQYITPVLNSGADVLILNHYGADMVHSLTQAVQFGLRDKQANGKHFEIVVPLFSELMAQGAGAAIKGIFGTANWDWKLDNERRSLRQVVRHRLWHAAVAGGAHLLRAGPALRERCRDGRHLLSAGRHQGAGRLRVRRHRATGRPLTAPPTTSASRSGRAARIAGRQVRPARSGAGRRPRRSASPHPAISAASWVRSPRPAEAEARAPQHPARGARVERVQPGLGARRGGTSLPFMCSPRSWGSSIAGGAADDLVLGQPVGACTPLPA